MMPLPPLPLPPSFKCVAAISSIGNITNFLTEVYPLPPSSYYSDSGELHLVLERMVVLLPIKSKHRAILKHSSVKFDVERQDGGVSPDLVRSPCRKIDFVKRTSNFSGNRPYSLFYHCKHGLEDLCSQERPLFGSSGNAHGFAYAQTFDEIVSQFRTVEAVKPFHLLAVDGDHLHDKKCIKHESTSMVRIAPNGHTSFTREGIHHAPGRCGRVHSCAEAAHLCGLSIVISITAHPRFAFFYACLCALGRSRKLGSKDVAGDRRDQCGLGYALILCIIARSARPNYPRFMPCCLQISLWLG